MINIRSALTTGREIISQTSPSPQIDADILLAHTLKVARAFLYTHPEIQLSDQQWDVFRTLITKRQSGIPIAYLVGTREFWSLPLQVNEHTLIPRPETELLVELALTLLAHKPHASILDLGTGSGAIALALAKERLDWNLQACDISLDAIAIARKNAENLNLTNITFYQSDWFSEIPDQLFDAIIANPPYLREKDPHLMQGDVRFEPKTALTSGTDGLDALHHIIQAGYRYLSPNGVLLLEHGFEQKEAVLLKLHQSRYQQTQCWQDWQGHDRICVGCKL